jgi:hypothetical protein
VPGQFSVVAQRRPHKVWCGVGVGTDVLQGVLGVGQSVLIASVYSGHVGALVEGYAPSDDLRVYLAHVTGFMAFDAYAHDDARRMFRFALSCAEEAGDWHLRAKVLSSMARQAIWCGDADTGLTFTELALVRSDRLTTTERAMLHTGRARALAKLGDIAGTVAAVGVADDEFGNTRPVNDPPWMAYYDAAQHAGDTGHALWDIAVNGHFVTEAQHRLGTAVTGHGDEFARARAISQTKLASLVMAVGDPIEAAIAGTQALAWLGPIRSRRAADDLRDLRRFGRPHDHVVEVAELRQRIGTAVIV